MYTNRHMEKYEKVEKKHLPSDILEKNSETKRSQKKEKWLDMNRENAVVDIDDQGHIVSIAANFDVEKSKKREVTLNVIEARRVNKASQKREKALEIPCSILSHKINKLHVKLEVNRERLLHEDDKKIFDKGNRHTHNKSSESIDRGKTSSNVPGLSSYTNRYFRIKYENDDDAENTSKSFHMIQSGVNIMENGIFYRGNRYASRDMERDKSPLRVSSSVYVLKSIPSDNGPHNGSKLHNNLLLKEHLDIQKSNKNNFGNGSNVTFQDQNIEDKKSMKAKIKMKPSGNKEKKDEKNSMTTSVFHLNFRNAKKRKPENKHKNKIGHTKKFQQEDVSLNRCFFDEEDDAILVLQLVQKEIKKQFERSQIDNSLNLKRDNQEQNEVKESITRLLSRIVSTTNIQTGTRKGKDTVFEFSIGPETIIHDESQENNEIHTDRNETDLQKHAVDNSDKLDNEKDKHEIIPPYFVDIKDIGVLEKENDTHDTKPPNLVDIKDIGVLEKENDKHDANPPYLVDIKEIGVNVTPPHHAKRKCKLLRVPSKKDRNKLVKVGGGWNDIYHYFERHVPVKRFEYKRSPDVKEDSFLSFRSHYKCPSKVKKPHKGK